MESATPVSTVRQRRRKQDPRHDLPFGQIQDPRDVEIVLRHALHADRVLMIIGQMLEMKITQIAAGWRLEDEEADREPRERRHRAQQADHRRGHRIQNAEAAER
jgi:hypothetical protein